tara:strand:+ start:988 stop:1224 length:237 start_codon:yes stop_codon:yes gene_type:complete
LTALFYQPINSPDLKFFDEDIPMAKKGPRQTIVLKSSADTGYQYFTSKNTRNTTEKLKIKKYDPVVRKHVEFVEGKMK